MERVLTQDERIRRAEEIYARRQNLREKTKKATLNVSSEPKEFKLLKKLVLQVIICVLMYFIFYLVNTTNYSFSEVTLAKTEELITQDIDFLAIYNNVTNWVGSYISKLNITEENTISKENEVQDQANAENLVQNQEEENKEQENQVAENKEQENENIAVSVNVEETTGQTEIQNTELSETDRIKQKYSFIKPINRNNNLRIWDKRINIKYNIDIS